MLRRTVTLRGQARRERGLIQAASLFTSKTVRNCRLSGARAERVLPRPSRRGRDAPATPHPSLCQPRSGCPAVARTRTSSATSPAARVTKPPASALTGAPALHNTEVARPRKGARARTHTPTLACLRVSNY